MAMIISKKLLIVVNVCGVISVIGNVEQMISDFQRGKTFEGLGGDVLSLLLVVGLAIYINVKYFKQKNKE
jgi:hypothetical protein